MPNAALRHDLVKILEAMKLNMVRFCQSLIVRKEQWGLSWRGRLLLATATLLATWFVLLELQPFLAVTHRVDANALVVEGWVHPFAIDAAVKEFKAGHYDRVFTTGGPVEGSGRYINDYNTEASVGADLLKQAGIPAGLVQMVPRAYGTGIALIIRPSRCVTGFALTTCRCMASMC